jgi:hypothetical protein
VADPAPPAPAAPAPAPQATDWEQRYRTLQGKYDAELPGLRAQVTNLERLIATMQSVPAAAPVAPAPATPAPAATTVVAPEDVEAYGQDLIDATQRWAAARYDATIADLRAEINALKGSTQRTEAQTTRQACLAALDADPDLAGKWRATNDDPKFLAWLDQVDPFIGRTRRDLLGEAYARGDAKRTGAFFKAFQAEHTVVTQAPPPPVAQTPQPGAGRPTLEDLAAPGRASGPGPSGATAEKRVWTTAQIQAFYRARTHGEFVGREAESLRIEQDIIAAATERRIR